jgi:hypothetical protein
LIYYEKEMDIDNKLNNYLKITGIINNAFSAKASCCECGDEPLGSCATELVFRPKKTRIK